MSEEGGSRDSSPTCFPGPCPRLCSWLIGESGCGTHSSSMSGFISGFYRRSDKQLLYRQSWKTVDVGERQCTDDLLLNIKAFFFLSFSILRGCQTECREQDGKAHQITQAGPHFLQPSLKHAVSEDSAWMSYLWTGGKAFFFLTLLTKWLMKYRLSCTTGKSTHWSI